ncbi:MAG TPA: hypothetical protein VN181_04825 [Thermoanaerobaculia bacterium]|nr:hypothetical protein [Thermoanaerobaculia bacterium]
MKYVLGLGFLLASTLFGGEWRSAAYDASSDSWTSLDAAGAITHGGTTLPVLRGAHDVTVGAGRVFAVANGVVFRFDGTSWTQIDDTQGARRIMARGDAILVITEDGVLRSVDGGASFIALPDIDASVTAIDANDAGMIIGTADGDVIENTGRVHLCKGPVTAVAAALASSAVYASCGASVFVRDDDGVWRTYAKNVGTIRTIAPDPFHGDAVFASTEDATLRIAAGGSVRVAEAADDLQVVHGATHSYVAARVRGSIRELQPVSTAGGCDVIVYNFSKNLTTRAEPNPTYDVLYYTSVYRIAVVTSTPTCRWTFDKLTKPDWVHAGFATGQVVPNTSITLIGSAKVDITIDYNKGVARSGSYTIRGPSYNIRSSVSQSGRKARCLHQPKPQVDPYTALSEGELMVITRHWGDAPVKSPRIISVLFDASGCHAEPNLWGVTDGFRGSTIQSAAEVGKVRHVLSSPYIAPNILGQAALYGLRGNGLDAAPSAMAYLLLPALNTLPADLQITKSTLPSTFYSVGRSGGAIVISGQVTRATTDPNRRCAFSSALYSIAGGNTWMAVSPTESGCEPGSPDRGKIVINVEGKGFSSTHYGIVYSPWGWYALIVQ